MKRTNKLPALFTALLVLFSIPAMAGDSGLNIPKPLKGEQCVEDTDEMRKNHMDYLKSHRDETMRLGIRTEKHSLKACLDCHVPAEGSKAAQSEEHFCKNCHSFAGVRLDCFECHATRPEMAAEYAIDGLTPDMKTLKSIHSVSSIWLNQMATNKNHTGAIQ
jgi:hypothetical protein